VFEKLLSHGAGGPSAIHPVGTEVVHFGLVLYICTADRPGLGARLSAVLTREGYSLHSPCIIVRTVRPGSADCPQVPNLFGQGLCVFGHLYYGLSGAWTVLTPRSWTVRPCRADSPRVLTLHGQSSGAPSCQVSDGPAKVGGLSGPRFSDSSNRFQTGKLVVTCTADCLASGHGPSACAQKVC
jgi:hypothetical protein